MAGIDLSAMSKAELQALLKETTKALKDFDDRRKKEAVAVLDAMAQEHGFSLSELTGKKAAKVPAPAKYRHPENPSVTWSGRGRQPQWFKDALEAGMSAESLAI